MVQANRKIRWAVIIPLLAVGLIVFVWLNYRLMTQADYPNIDFGYFYAGGRVLIEGHDPYSVPAIEAIYTEMGRTRYDPLVKAFPYPLWTDFIFAPFGFLSLEWATTIWTIFNELCFVATFWLLVRTLLKGQSGQERRQSAEFLLFWGVLLFVPSRHFIKALLNGQTTFLTTLMVALFIYAAAHKRYELAGLALLVGLLKPTSYMLLIPIALLWLLPAERRRGLYAFISGSAVLVLASFLINPGWLGEWLGARTNDGWQIIRRIATVWGTASTLTEIGGVEALFPLVAGLILVGLLFGIWYCWRKLPALRENTVLGWGILASLSIYLSLYAFSYESVVLFVPLMGILAQVRRYQHRQRTLVLVGLGVLLLIIPWLLIPLGTPLDEISAGLFPLSMVIFGWLVAALDRQQPLSAEMVNSISTKVVNEVRLK